MNQKNKETIMLVLVLLVLGSACSTPRKPVMMLEAPGAAWRALEGEADIESFRNHYLGWLKAEELYDRAMAAGSSPELRRKRLVNLALLAARRRELGISMKSQPVDFEQFRPAEDDKIGLVAFWLLRYYNASFRADFMEFMRALQKEPLLEPAEFASDRDLYLYHLYCSNHIYELEERRARTDPLEQAMAAAYSGSPLAMFLERTPSSSQEKYYELDRDFLEPRYFDALMALQLNQRGRAESLFNYVEDRCPGIPGVERGLGLINLAFEDYDRAEACFQKVLDFLPNDNQSLFGLGAARLYRRDYESSLATFTLMVERNLPYQGEARYYQALNLYHLGRLIEALASAVSAGEYLPQSYDLRQLEGLIHFQAGDHQAAALAFQQAVRLGRGQEALARHYLGLLSVMTRADYRGALEHFEQAALLDLADLERRAAGLAAQAGPEEGGGREAVLKKKQFQRLARETLERRKSARELLAGSGGRLRTDRLENSWKQAAVIEARWLNRGEG